jgi:hypothetical protein
VARQLIVNCSGRSDRTEPRINAVLSKIGDDPQLLEACQLKGGSDLRVWLKAIAAEHADERITVRWTDDI